MKRFGFILPIITIALLSSCKKAEITETPPQPEIQLENRKDSLEINSSNTSLFVKKINKMLNGSESSSHEDYVDIDINEDGKKDFRIVNKHFDDSKIDKNSVSASELIALHADAFFNTHIQSQTVYCNTEVDIIKKSKVEKFIKKYVSNESTSGSQIVNEETISLPFGKVEFDYINPNGSWEGNSIPLTIEPYELPIQIIKETVDSLIYQKGFYDFSSRSILGNKFIYIGLKLHIGDQVKLGWVKVKSTGFKNIMVIESAIER